MQRLIQALQVDIAQFFTKLSSQLSNNPTLHGALDKCRTDTANSAYTRNPSAVSSLWDSSLHHTGSVQ
jgi:hypothetical protein